MRLFGTIEKWEEREDGHLVVFGVASSEAVDSDGEIITAAAMKAAIPDYMKFGNIREMHQPSAAGTAMACEVGEDGRTTLEALVVDPVAKEKVRTGTYKGFSIGGKVTKRSKNIIEGLKLVEISLVDRPANPEATFSLAKMEDAVDANEQSPEVQPTPDPTPNSPGSDAEKAEGPDLAKFMGEEVWDAMTALNALDAIMWLLSKEQAEPMEDPAQVTSLRAVVENLKRFIASEVLEDNSGKAAGTDDLEKRGAKFSKATKAALKAAQEAMEAGASCLKALGYEEADEDEGDGDTDKAAHAETLAKAAGLESDLAKVSVARDEALAKAAALQVELDTLKAQKPLKAVPIEKSADSKITKSQGEEQAEAPATDPLQAMRNVHKAGGTLITLNRLG